MHAAATASTENHPASSNADVVATFFLQRTFIKDLQLFKGPVAEVGLASAWGLKLLRLTKFILRGLHSLSMVA